MDTQTVMLLAVLLSVFGTGWKLHTDIGELRERMARLEGLIEGFTKRGAD